MAGGGLAALSLAGCGGDDDGGGGDGGSGAQTGGQALDSTKGNAGGKFIHQTFGWPGTIVLVKTSNSGTAQFAGFSHSALLEFKNGRPIVEGTDISVDPDQARALPEQPDDVTYVFKLKKANFQNGRAVTAEDVKYSFDRYAFAADSA